MSVSPRYFEYLTHFGKTMTVRELASNPDRQNALALRHDVDHDLDLALELAYWEHEHGLESTYYVLNTAPYWSTADFADKCLQIQDFGHEIGLHFNALVEWRRGEIAEIGARLAELLDVLRDAGLHVDGLSAHGDEDCYDSNIINYWCFSELRPPDPECVESGLTPEGIRPGPGELSIRYPTDHVVRRDDGDSSPLWSLSLRDFGLRYDANHIELDRYFSDSGGDFRRTGDPLQTDLSVGRHQVLMHPSHWRGPGRIYFFVSTARAGSKWMSRILDRATPCVGRHEFTLNHTMREGDLVPEKRTGERFVEFASQRSEVRRLMSESRTWIDQLEADYAECNVYLPHFLQELGDTFGDATIVHQYRQDRDVVRSVINRGWYEESDDPAHLPAPVEGWGQLSQFEKACHYWRAVNLELLEACELHLQAERLFTDESYLAQALKHLGIPYYPRLAVGERESVVNANVVQDFPTHDRWSEEQRATLDRICGEARPQLEASTFRAQREGGPPIRREPTRHVIACLELSRFGRGRITSANGRFERTMSGLVFTPEQGRHNNILIGGHDWNSVLDGDGYVALGRGYYRLSIRGRFERDRTMTVYVQMFGTDGATIDTKAVGHITGYQETEEFSFRLRADTYRFSIAIYASSANLPTQVQLDAVHLEHVGETSDLDSETSWFWELCRIRRGRRILLVGAVPDSFAVACREVGAEIVRPEGTRSPAGVFDVAVMAEPGLGSISASQLRMVVERLGGRGRLVWSAPVAVPYERVAEILDRRPRWRRGVRHVARASARLGLHSSPSKLDAFIEAGLTPCRPIAAPGKIYIVGVRLQPERWPIDEVRSAQTT